MSFAVSDVLTRVRFELADDFTTQRFSDAKLIPFVNDALDEILVRFPKAYERVGTLTLNREALVCNVGDFVDADSSAAVLRVFDFLADADAGQMVKEMPLGAFEAQVPDWHGDVDLVLSAPDTGVTDNGLQSTAVRYCVPLSDESFVLFPKPTAGKQFSARFTPQPATLTDAADIIDFKRLYLSIVVDYVCYRVLLRDAESSPQLLTMSGGYMTSFDSRIAKLAEM